MIETDDLDEAIIRKLQADGRSSNRQIGRELNVSEGTVRKRLKRLHDLRALRLTVVTDLRAIDLMVAAYVRLAVAPANARSVASYVAGLEECGYAAFAAGRFNVLCFLIAGDRMALAKIVDEDIATLGGVHDVNVCEVVSTIKHRFDLVSIT
ncbi:MAG: transcriptional regulator, AsnC family [Caulobacter sp.]|nr:transcriptional regulator, AsnC family [Caulobacter sp.]